MCVAALTCWYIVCSLGVWSAPLALFFAVALNGSMAYSARQEAWDQGEQCLVFTDEVTENKVMGQIEQLLQVQDLFFTLQTALNAAASVIEGVGYIISGGDIMLSTVFYVAVGALSLALSGIFLLLSLQSVVYWVGALVFIGGHIAYPWVPSVTQIAADDLEAKRAIAFGLYADESADKQKQVFEGKHSQDAISPENIAKRIPNDFEIWHRYIAEKVQMQRPLEVLS